MLRWRKREEWLTSLYSAISQADDVIIVTDAKGRSEFANDSFPRVSGYTPDELIGKDNINMLTSGVYDERLCRSLWSETSNGRNWTGQVTGRRKDGTIYQERVKISPTRNKDDLGKIFDPFFTAKDEGKIVLDYLSAALRRLNIRVDPFDDSRQALQVFKKMNKAALFFLSILKKPVTVNDVSMALSRIFRGVNCGAISAGIQDMLMIKPESGKQLLW